jgi:hypothetical protein
MCLPRLSKLLREISPLQESDAGCISGCETGQPKEIVTYPEIKQRSNSL